MNLLRVMIRYVGYYILVTVLISVFVATSIKGALNALCGAALSVSMFAAIIQLLIDGCVGETAQKLSVWCLRGTIIITIIVIIAGVGIENIAKIFI